MIISRFNRFNDNIYYNQKCKRVIKYFSSSYPNRSRFISSFFRSGERERISFVKKMIMQNSYSRVLDIGCGDGYFLSQVLETGIELLRIEDINPKNIESAENRLHSYAVNLDSQTIDSLKNCEQTKYDLVMAIGLLDYYPNWEMLLTFLLQKTEKTLILDFPRAYTFQWFLRCIWLMLHRIELNFAVKKTIIKLLDSINYNFEIEKLSYSWLVKIDK